MNSIASQFQWKNFNLNMELHISGAFIYEGIFILDRLDQLNAEEDCFLFLYNISVGIERLEKIAYLLLAHKSGDLNPANKLKSHNHTSFYDRIKYYATLPFSKRETDFLELLRRFYANGRYNRFNYNENVSEYIHNNDKDILFNYLEKYLNLNPISYIGCSQSITLSQTVKDSIGEIISSIVLPLYRLICDTAYSLHLFTYEIRYGSKAYKIFIEQEFSFYKEHITQREIILKLINSPTNKYIEPFHSIAPIDLENQTISNYIKYLINFSTCMDIKDEVSQIYEDNHLENRASQIELIGSEYDCDDESDELEVDVINVAQFNVDDIFTEKIYKNGNKRISVRKLNSEEITLICTALRIFKYQYCRIWYFMRVNNDVIEQINNRELSRLINEYISEQLIENSFSRDYRNAFLQKYGSIIPINLLKDVCPIVMTSREMDHKIGMCIDKAYRNNYLKDELLRFLQIHEFLYAKSKTSQLGYYYKLISPNKYLIVDIATFDESKACYVFDLLEANSQNNRHPNIEDGKIIIYGLDIIKHREILERLLTND